MSTQLLTLLDQLDPVDRDRVRARPTPEDELQAILASNGAAGFTEPPPRRPRLRRALLIAAAAAVVIVVGAALLPGGDGGGASPEAARALESAAATAAAADVVPAGAGEYEYSRVGQVNRTTIGAIPLTNSYSYYMPTTIESWIAPDGSGRVREIQHAAEWPGPRDELRWRESGHPLARREETTNRRYGPGELDGRVYEAELPPVRNLPTDPGALARVFEEADRGDVPPNVKMFEYGTSVLLHAGAAPELRSATYEVLAGIEGVELAGKTKDPLGRTGIEVSITQEYSGNVPERYSLIYDEETAHPLAYTERLLEPVQYIDSRLSGYTLLEESGVVGSVAERP